MSGTIDMEAIRKLSVEERLKLMAAIWDSLAEDEADLSVAKEALAEMERRLDELEAGPNQGVPYTEMLGRLRGLRK